MIDLLYNDLLVQNKEKVLEYQKEYSTIENGEILSFGVFNPTINEIRDVQFTIVFPEKVYIINSKPERPITKAPIRNFSTIVSRIIHSSSNSSILPSISKVKQDWGQGPRIQNKKDVWGILNKISNRTISGLLDNVYIGSFEEGEYEIEWTLTYEGLTKEIEGTLILLVE